jgi:uncharacterized protein (TIGR00251 family)
VLAPPPLKFNVRIKANAINSYLMGWYGQHIKIAVKAPAIDGKANKALIALLAKFFSVRQLKVIILRGESSRIKQVSIQGSAFSLEDVIKLKMSS